MAVGDWSVYGTDEGPYALGSHWDGKSWHDELLNTAAQFAAVSCSGPTCCMAVGTNDTNTKSLSEAWNGRRWKFVSIPQAPDPVGGQVNAISCTSSSNCVAVGSGTTVADEWNGETWNPIPPPHASRQTLYGIDCHGPQWCMAVGIVGIRALSELWNGKTWIAESTPRSPATPGTLLSVSCPATSYCQGVGGNNYFTPSNSALAYGWNGTVWSSEPLPNPTHLTKLNSVSCTSATFCMAFGWGVHCCRPLVTGWNGTLWRPAALPPPPDETLFAFWGWFDVSCAMPSFCVAVGAAVSSDSDSQPFTNSLISQWNGSTWVTLTE